MSFTAVTRQWEVDFCGQVSSEWCCNSALQCWGYTQGHHPQVVNSFPATNPQWQPRKTDFTVIWWEEPNGCQLGEGCGKIVVGFFFFFSKEIELSRKAYTCMKIHEVLGCGDHLGDDEERSEWYCPGHKSPTKWLREKTPKHLWMSSVMLAQTGSRRAEECRPLARWTHWACLVLMLESAKEEGRGTETQLWISGKN